MKISKAIKVQPHTIRTPSFDGWGCSLCWWGNEYGTAPVAPTLADYMFSSGYTNSLPGLGMNIVRYNVGGGGSNGGIARIDDNTVENISPQNPVYNPLNSFRYMNGFWRNWFSDDPNNSESWDWTADPRQRALLQLAQERGVNLIEFFSNSPPWWMCYNHSCSGANSISLISGDNLQDWNYGQFAKYLAIVVQYFRDHGIPVHYIEPFNEPGTGWWTYPGGQEGCNFATTTQTAVLRHLHTELANRNLLPTVGITASDENSMYDALATLVTWRTSSDDPTGLLTKINVHGYDGQSPYRGGRRTDLRNAITMLPDPPKWWMSEYGDGDASGLTMATSIMLDMAELQPQAWIYWQPIDPVWGFFSQAAPNDYGNALRKFYVFAQFSRHIKQGYSILDSDSPWIIVAHSSAEKVISIVYLNTTTNLRYIDFDISDIVSNHRVVDLRGYQTTTQPGVNQASDALYQPLNPNSNQLNFNVQSGTVSALSQGYDVTSIDVVYE